MGDIKVKGVAKKRVKADEMYLSITIKSKEKTTSRALKTVREQCESLLELLNSEATNAASSHVSLSSLPTHTPQISSPQS